MNSNLVSVIIPFYRVEDYIEECLNSIVNQTYKNLEIICIDDCSDDNSLKIVERFAKFDDRIKIVKHTENKKQGGARNTGLDIAIGDYIYFIDSDDFIDLNYIEELVNAIEKYSVDIVVNQNIVKYFSKSKFEQFYNKKIGSNIILEINNQNLQDIPMMIWCKIYKREFLIKNNIKFPQKIKYEDTTFNFLSLILSKNIYLYKGNSSYFYVQRNNSTIYTNKKEIISNFDMLENIGIINSSLYERKLFDSYKIPFLWLKMHLKKSNNKIIFFKEIRKFLFSLKYNVDNYYYLYNNKEIIFFESVLIGKNYLSFKLNYFISKILLNISFFKKKLYTNKIKKLINKNIKNKDSIIFIFQNSFYTLDSKRFYSGGAERYCLDLSNILNNLGFEIILFQNSNNGLWIKEFNNLKIIGIEKFNKLNYCDLVYKSSIKSRFNIYSMITFFKKSTLKNNIFKNSLLLFHGIFFDGYGCKNKNKIKLLLNKFRYILSVDTNSLSFFRSLFGSLNLNNNFYCIPNYADCSKFKPLEHKRDSNKIRILFARRLCDYRGYWLCSNIFDKVMQLNSNIEFDFVGFIHDNKIKNDLDILQKKYYGRVHHWLLEPDKMYELYKNYDISLIPTLCSEGTSLSCIESQSSGCAVIATNIGSLPNLIINNFNGILINPDENELFEAIEKVVNNKEFRNYLSDNALHVAKHFDKNNWENSWKNVFNKLIDNKNV